MKKLLPGLAALVLFGCSPDTIDKAAEKYGDAIDAGKYKLAARQYCDSINAGNFEVFKSLFSANYHALLTEDLFCGIRPASCRLDSIDPPHAIIRYTTQANDEETEQIGSIYFLSNGKIKYDPIYIRHPALSLRVILSQMESEEPLFRENAFRRMKTWHLPLFGFNPSSEPYTQSVSVDQFGKWVEENEPSFDLSEPKMPLSSLDLEVLWATPF